MTTESSTRLPRVAWAEFPVHLQRAIGAQVDRLGYVGEFFELAAHQPAALTAFARFTAELKDAVSWRLVEAIALNIAAATGNAYERVQHERRALQLGMTRDVVRAHVAGVAAGHPDIAADEAAAADLARVAAESHGHEAGPAFERLRDLTSDAVAVGCLMVVARYLAHSMIVNTWRLDPPVSSPLDDARVEL